MRHIVRALAAVAASVLVTPQVVASTPTPGSLGQPGDLSNPFGIHLGGNANPGRLDLIGHSADLGARWLRVNIVWSDIETAEGHFDWSLPDALAREAERIGVQLLIQIRGFTGGTGFASSPLYRSDPGRKLAAFGTFLGALARRFRGQITYWQIENEVDNRAFWLGTVEDYARVLRAAYKAIKDENDVARVLVAGYSADLADEWLAVDQAQALRQEWVRNRLAHLQTFLRSTHGAYDIFDVHLYRSPETIPARINFLRQQMRAANIFDPRPIWVTETGGPDTRWPYGQFPPPCGRPCTDSYQELPPEMQQAEVVTRLVLLLANGAGRVFWHALGTKEAPRSVWDQASLIRRGERTPAFYTYQLLVRKLQGFSRVSRLDVGTGIHAYHFARPVGDVIVLWGSRSGTVGLPVGWARVSITDLAGRSSSVESTQVVVSTSPRFVEASRD